MFSKIISLLQISLMCLVTVWMGPGLNANKLPSKRAAAPDITNYLTNFGYLSSANLETAALRTPEEFTRAIKELQKMAGLDQTGDAKDPRLVELMKKSRCGMKDVKPSRNLNTDPNGPSSFYVRDDKWNKKDVTYKIISYSVDMDQGQQRVEISKAFDMWSNSADINFHEVNPAAEADIVISFANQQHGDGYPFDGPGGVLAHAFPPGEDRGGDAHFDEDETWSNDGNSEKIDLFIVAAHELGHSLGIYHSEVQGALMYPWYAGYTPNFQLHYDDIQAIQTLYGGSKRRGAPPTVSTRATKRPMVIVTTPTPRPIPTPRPEDGQPNPCNTDIDAATSLRGEVFAFKGKWYWRFDQKGKLMDDKPRQIAHFFSGLPKTLNVIDAVTEIPGREERMMYISGDRYWLLKALDLVPSCPRDGISIYDLGLPRDVTKIDAALYWKFNERVYLFAGYRYWRLSNDTRTLKVEKDYPKAFDIWEGIPVPIDAAYSTHEGDTYFFKETQFWKLNNQQLSAEQGYPKDIGQMWLNCVFSYTKEGTSSSFNLKHDVTSYVIVTIFSVLFTIRAL